eukprot:scaffold27758_cov112-Isochrysis_galbana.AAC.2
MAWLAIGALPLASPITVSLSLPFPLLRVPLAAGARLACTPLGAALSRSTLCVSAEGFPDYYEFPSMPLRPTFD